MVLFYVGVIAFAIPAGRYLQLAAFASVGVQREEKLKDPQFIAEGAKLFAPSCGNAYCHGTGGESAMPKDYASIYTIKQLLDLVTFLKSSESKSPVTLKDLFQ